MGRGFGKGKYKKIIKSIYPLTSDGDIQVHNIGKLVHFCQISPTKLIKVSAYLEKKTNSDLTKSKLRFVGASMKIFQDLIKGCRKNLNLFSNNVLRLIKLLLECSFPKLKRIAAETFIQFTEVLDENTPYPELEGLITYLIDMCQNQIRDAAVQTRLKQDGLKSIRAYIRVLEMTDELDGFIARHADEDNWAVLLPAILDNLSFPGPDPSVPRKTSTPPLVAPVSLQPSTSTYSIHDGEEDARAQTHESTDSLSIPRIVSDVPEESVHVLATEVLRDIFSRANISVTSLFKAILRYLEFRQRWTPNTFAVYIIQSIYDCLKVQHGQILITLLLQHAELSQHPIAVRTQIFMTTIQFFTESTGYFMQILDSLMKHLVSSVEFVSQDQHLADIDPHLAFQNALISGLGILCSKISHQQKLDAFSALCTRLSMSKHVSSSGLSGVVVVFARAILQITLNTQNFPIDLLMPSLRLFHDLSMHNNTEVRIFVQKIFQSILLPASEMHQNIPRRFDDAFPEQIATVVRGTLYAQMKMRIKHAENYVALFDTLRAMLFRGGKNDLVESFPLIFAVQKFATKWKKIPPIRAYTIHTLVAAYLYCVAFLFKCKALETHVDEIIQEREQAGQACSCVFLQKRPIPTIGLTSTADYNVALQKKVAVTYVLFDRQVVVDILCSEDSSTIDGEKRFPKILMKKFRNQNDTSTLTKPESLTTSESTYFVAPPTPMVPSTHPAHEDGAQNGTTTPTALSKSTVIFSPDLAGGSNDEFDKTHRSSKIDIMTMKRALVIGVPSISSHKRPTSFSDIVNNSNQKILNAKLISTLSTQHDEKPVASWCVFDLDLTALNS